ncbi:hypothetical protein PC128_g12704 [Phytophthora cactorum]|nr:hypothetical protein PC120_g19728 [Phytophthora cactorum]KAG3053040.1 hypothetical protein PC121_g17004 [Phytophthora cactorum]KAG3187216.1 hypothetical protein PC128_g12704 [Phytophthora cactorum]KAG4039670.1 hypothetical protein PC123_g24783 [Phytophthora cactorum]
MLYVAQRTLVSQQQRAVTAKTLAGSGKERLAARKGVDDEGEDYNPGQDEEADESDMVDEHEDNIAAPSTKRARQNILPRLSAGRNRHRQ